MSSFDPPSETEHELDGQIEKRMDLSRALTKVGYADVLVLSKETGAELLTKPRVQLLDHLGDNDVDSVRALADALDRDKAAVSRDLKQLAKFDVVEYEEVGRSKAPQLKHATVVVEPLV